MTEYTESDAERTILMASADGGLTWTPVEDPTSLTATVAGTVAVSNLPVTQPVSGTVAVSAVSGTVTVGAHDVAVPAGVAVTNLPATQPVSGTVTVQDGGGAISVDDNGSTLSVDDGGGSVTVDGTFWQATQPVSGTFWQATQPVSGTVTADTELPAAAALADGVANPTAPAVGGFNMGWNGSTWDRLKATANALWCDLRTIAGTAIDTNSGNKSAGTQRVVIATDQPALTNTLLVDTELAAAAALADLAANPTVPSVGGLGLGFNGSSWDRWRNNTAPVAMGDTGTKTVTFNGATQVNYNSSGTFIYVLLGTVSGTTPTLALRLQVSLDAGTTWINFGPAMSNLTATGQLGMFVVSPNNTSQAAGGTPANMTHGATQAVFLNAQLPRNWRLTYTIAGTTPSFAITTTNACYVV